MANPWFKFYGPEYLSDPKMLGLHAGERSCWITLLSYASLSDGLVRFLTEEQLMIQSGIELDSDIWKKTSGIYQKFVDLQMITLDNVTVVITNWPKRQGNAMSVYERVKKFREKSKDDNGMITDREDKKREDKKREEEILASFEKFWSIYPNKTAKKKALQFWMKINPDSKLADSILKGLEKYKKSSQWQENGGKYIPHPTTWLNQERWNDEVTEKPVLKIKTY